MARNHFTVSLLAALALGACGGKDSGTADADAAADRKLAALRARNDSIGKARAALAADSAARVRYAACSDSVTALAAKAAPRKGAKAAADQPDVATACGEPHTASLAAATPPAATGTDTVKAAGRMTPQQMELARADSSHRASEATKATAQRLATEQAQADSTRLALSDSTRSDSLSKVRETEVQRETFAYAGGGRDPFGSLMDIKNDGPELADLQLVGVYQDLRYSSNSVAVLREKVTGKRHKLRAGDVLGRLRVSQIRPREVVFQVNDFGFDRQETLSLRKQEDVTP